MKKGDKFHDQRRDFMTTRRSTFRMGWVRPLSINGPGNLELWARELLFPGSCFQLNVCTRKFPDREILISGSGNQEFWLRLLRCQKWEAGRYQFVPASFRNTLPCKRNGTKFICTRESVLYQYKTFRYPTRNYFCIGYVILS